MACLSKARPPARALCLPPRFDSACALARSARYVGAFSKVKSNGRRFALEAGQVMLPPVFLIFPVTSCFLTAFFFRTDIVI